MGPLTSVESLVAPRLTRSALGVQSGKSDEGLGGAGTAARLVGGSFALSSFSSLGRLPLVASVSIEGAALAAGAEDVEAPA